MICYLICYKLELILTYQNRLPLFIENVIDYYSKIPYKDTLRLLSRINYHKIDFNQKPRFNEVDKLVDNTFESEILKTEINEEILYFSIIYKLNQ